MGCDLDSSRGRSPSGRVTITCDRGQTFGTRFGSQLNALLCERQPSWMLADRDQIALYLQHRLQTKICLQSDQMWHGCNSHHGIRPQRFHGLLESSASRQLSVPSKDYAALLTNQVCLIPWGSLCLWLLCKSTQSVPCVDRVTQRITSSIETILSLRLH